MAVYLGNDMLTMRVFSGYGYLYWTLRVDSQKAMLACNIHCHMILPHVWLYLWRTKRMVEWNVLDNLPSKVLLDFSMLRCRVFLKEDSERICKPFKNVLWNLFKRSQQLRTHYKTSRIIVILKKLQWNTLHPSKTVSISYISTYKNVSGMAGKVKN